MTGPDDLRWHQPHIPKDIGELYDVCGLLMLSSPKFLDDDFPGQNLESVFFAFNTGIENCRGWLGDGNCARLLEISAAMREHFEADPDDNGRARLGRKMIHEVEDLIRDAARRTGPANDD